MGNAGAKVSDGMYPAKFTFNVNASPDCLNDFIVFGEDIASLAAVAASGTGTFSGTGQGTNTQTVTVNGTAFTATGAYASDSGTFTSPPASNTALTLTNNSPANVLTLTTNATTASAIGTFATTPPAFNTSITITNSAVSPSNTLTLTTNATGSHATGTFATPPLATSAYTINSGSNTLSLTTNGTGRGATGTFTGPPSAGTMTITSGSNALVLTNSATASNATGTFSGSPTSTTTPTITVTSGTNTLTLTSNANAAHATGTFTAAPSNGNITITSGSNTLTLANGGTGANATGTFSGSPFSNTAITITSGSNTLSLTNNGTGSTTIATFGSTADTTASHAITITSGSNTITLNPGASNTCTGVASPFGGTFVNSSTSGSTNATALTAAINACPAAAGVSATQGGGPNANKVTVTHRVNGDLTVSAFSVTNTATNVAFAAVTAGTNGSNTCGSSTAGTFATSSSTTTLASNLAAAINLCPAGADVSATSSVDTVTATDTTSGSFTTFSVAGSNLTGIYSWSGVTAGTNGTTNGCTSSTAGTFVTSNTTATLASNVAAAINSCNGSFGVGTTATASTNTVTATSTTLGTSTFSVGENIVTGFAWGATTAGSNGSTTCSGSAPNFSGTFIASPTTSTLATNLATTINTAGCAAAGVAASASGSSVTVTDSTPGDATVSAFSVGGANLAGIYSWGAPTTGTNGTINGCTSSTAGTFTTAATASGVASNVATAITNCTSSFSTVGLSASVSAGAVTARNTTPGTFTTFSVATNLGRFSWGAVTAGSNGSNACTTATAGTFATSATLSTLATNLAAAINACPTGAGVTASASGSTVTATDRTPGDTTVSAFSVGGADSTFSWGLLTTGSNGSNGCGSSTAGTFATSSSNNTLASNVATALAACPAAVGVTATSSTNTVTVTQRKPGAFLAVGAANNTGIYSWGSVSGGSAGSNGCTGNTTGTYATSAAPSVLATNLAVAINACTPSTVGVTAVAIGSAVNLTAATLGSGANGILAGQSNNAGIFSWSGASLSGGLNGNDTGANFSISSSPTTEATNFTNALNRTSAAGVTAASSSGTVTVTAASAGTAGNNITLADTLSNFAWSGSTLAGGANGQPSLAALNNLYVQPDGSGFCSGLTAPTVKWAYRTTTAPVVTSPVLSTNGAKVAYVESSNPPALHVLTIGTTGNNGSIGGPAVPGTSNNAADVSVPYGATGDTRSSPFVDYTDDVAYVAADDGHLYKFTGVFKGAPALVTTGGWPLTIATGGNSGDLTSPVLDSVTQRIFIGDGNGVLHFVRLSPSDLCTGSVAAPCVDSTTLSLSSGTHAIIDAPIVDSANQKIFAFLQDNGSGHYTLTQADTSFGIPVTVPLGANTGAAAHIGAFDNAYFSFTGTGTNNGHLYVCGTEGINPNPGSAALYRVGFTGATMNSTSSDGPLQLVTSGSAGCSPLTEFFNPNASGGTEFLFVSVTANCSATLGASGCIRAFNITGGFPADTASAPTVAEDGGTSGIVVDNVNLSSGASSIYFSTQADAVKNVTGSNAIKLTQSGLQ